MAGEARVEMRWPVEVHARAKALAAERGTNVTSLCLALLMAELERVGSFNPRRMGK